MKIHIELDTSTDSDEKISSVLDFLKGEKREFQPPTIRGRMPPFGVVPSKTPILDKKDLSDLFSKIKDGVKEADKLKGSRRPRSYSYQLKRDIISYVKAYKSMHPEVTMQKIGQSINVDYTTFADWLKGKNLGGVGQKKNKKIGYGKKNDMVKERNEKIVNYLNKNPYECWENAGKKFGLSSTATYSVAKQSGKVKIMKRDWSEMITKDTGLRTPLKPVEIKEETETPSKTMGQVILKFEKSRVDANKTIDGINECIGKGSLTYREDADKFGFDRRVLPITDWYDFMTEVAKVVNRIMGIDVILDPTLSGITFKK